MHWCDARTADGLARSEVSGGHAEWGSGLRATVLTIALGWLGKNINVSRPTNDRSRLGLAENRTPAGAASRRDFRIMNFPKVSKFVSQSKNAGQPAGTGTRADNKDPDAIAMKVMARPERFELPNSRPPNS